MLQRSSSGFSYVVGSGVSNEGTTLRVNGSLEVGMSSRSSSVQRVDSHSVEKIKVGDQFLQRVLECGEGERGPLLNFCFGTPWFLWRMGWGREV